MQIGLLKRAAQEPKIQFHLIKINSRFFDIAKEAACNSTENF
jgi:hypothetical protein